VCTGNEVTSYSAEVVSATDYSPFGAPLAGRSFTAANVKYAMGFNGKMKDDEAYGDGNCYDYGFRIYNPRLGKFLSVDPLTHKFAFYSSYQYAGNKPIVAVDLDGLEDAWIHVVKDKDGTVIKTITDVDIDDGDRQQMLQMGLALPTQGVVITSEWQGKTCIESYTPRIEITDTKTEKNKFVKILEELDRATQGHNDGANTGYTTKQDIAVATGVIGTMTGAGVMIEAGAITAGGAISFGLSVDDIFTNRQGESYIESKLPSESTKALYTASKTMYQFGSRSAGIVEIGKEGATGLKVTNVLMDSYGAATGTITTGQHIQKAKETEFKK
jgi:RHS repeat-associated protein